MSCYPSISIHSSDWLKACQPLALGGSAINQAIRQIGSVMGVALTVLPGGAGLQRADFNAVYLCHMSPALLTAVLCLLVNTLPAAVAEKL